MEVWDCSATLPKGHSVGREQAWGSDPGLCGIHFRDFSPFPTSKLGLF